MRLKPLLFVMFLILFSFVCMGDYRRMGGLEQDYQVDYNVFGAPDTVTTTTGIIELSSGSTYPPLISDLNKDGVKEIIVLEGSGITLYHSKNLVSVTGVTHGLTSPTSNLEIFDIDGDGTNEIILAGANKEIKIFSFNGSHIVTENTLNFVWAAYSGGSMLIRCRDTNECLLIAQDEDTRSATDLRAFVFSSANGTQATLNLETTASSNIFNCFSKLPQIMLGNLDNQGDDEYIITSVLVDITGSEELKVYAVWVNNTDETDVSLLWDVNLRTNGFSNEQSCEAGLYENWVSPPLVYDISNDNGDLSEIAVAYRKTATEIELAYMIETGEIIKTFPNFPELWYGASVSNVIPLDYHPDTSVTDMCVLTNTPGYNQGLYCTAIDSILFGWITGTNEIYFLTSWNLTNEYKSYKGLIQITDSNNGDDLPDLTTTWGIIYIPDMNNELLCTHDTCNTGYIWQSPKVNGSFIISSVDDTNGDVLVRQKESLWYIDDNFINTPGQITGVSFNPCITQDIVKVNSTISVTVTVDDFNGDDVNARAIFYYGESFDVAETEETIYYSLTNESESDGLLDGASNYFLGESGTFGNLSQYLLIKDAVQGKFNTLIVNVSGTVNDPEDQNFLYDVYICETVASSLVTSPLTQCTTTPLKLKDDFALSVNWGAYSGLKTIPLDVEFSMSSVKSYILWLKFNSGGDRTAHYYETDNDGSPSNIFQVIERSLDTNSSNSRINPIYLANIKSVEESFDSGWTETDRSHGSSFLFRTTASVILNNAILKVCGRDTVNPSQQDCRDYTYSVGVEGVVYGDTICEESYELEEAITEEEEEVPELTDVPASIIPVDTIPPTYYPLISLLIIGLISIGAVFISSQNGIKEGNILVGVGGGSALLTWIALIFVGMVAAWTLLVGLMFAAAGIGITVFIGSNR